MGFSKENNVEDIHFVIHSAKITSWYSVDEETAKEEVGTKRPRAQTAPPRVNNQHEANKPHFLKKNQRLRVVPEIDKSEFKCLLKSTRPPLPKPLKVVEERPKRNFIKQNVEKVHKMSARQPAPIIVINCKGDRQDMRNYLDGQRIRESPSYGQVPKYLTARRKAWEQDYTERMKLTEETTQEKEVFPGYRQVPEDERQALLKGLKDRWLEVNKEFTVLPVLCDTLPKVKRKLRLENQLKALEKDIQLLETNPFIYLDVTSNKPQGI